LSLTLRPRVADRPVSPVDHPPTLAEDQTTTVTW
jgi:hypothetical protein